MKNTVTTIFAAIITLTGLTQTEPVGIQFETGSWAEALAKAKQQNKYVFVDTYASWCGPCKLMSRTVFSQAETGNFFNANFINVKIDLDRGEGSQIAQKYGVYSIPTYLFVDGNGELMHQFGGAMEMQEFIDAAAEVINPEKQYAALVKRYDAGERDSDLLYNAAMAAKSAEDPKAAVIAEDYLKTQTNLLEKKNLNFLFRLVEYRDDPNFEFMRKHAAEFHNVVGKDAYETRMFNIIYYPYYTALVPNSDMKKKEMAALFTEAETYFNKILPEQTPKMMSHLAMDISYELRDWDNYAKQAIECYTLYPSEVPQEIDGIAWTIFEHTKKSAYLEKALELSLKSISMSDEFSTNNTAAHLYHKLGNNEKAKVYADKAIALGKTEGEDISATEKLLKAVDAN